MQSASVKLLVLLALAHACLARLHLSGGRQLLQEEQVGVLSDSEVELLLGEWELTEVKTHVPKVINPGGVSFMTGVTLDRNVMNIVNGTEYGDMTNRELSDELQRRVVRVDNPKLGSSNFLIVAVNPISGATVAYNTFENARGVLRMKRTVGSAWKAADGSIQLRMGEQPTPAQWDLAFRQGSSGWQMSATRLQPYQMGTVNGTTSERQSILFMSPFQKTNTTLSEIFPYIAEQLTGR